MYAAFAVCVLFNYNTMAGITGRLIWQLGITWRMINTFHRFEQKRDLFVRFGNYIWTWKTKSAKRPWVGRWNYLHRIKLILLKRLLSKSKLEDIMTKTIRMLLWNTICIYIPDLARFNYLSELETIHWDTLNSRIWHLRLSRFLFRPQKPSSSSSYESKLC